jgi:dsRNA-specific ribonuclease
MSNSTQSISQVCEMARVYSKSLISYDYSRSGSDHKPLFKCTITLTTQAGTVLTYVADGDGYAQKRAAKDASCAAAVADLSTWGEGFTPAISSASASASSSSSPSVTSTSTTTTSTAESAASFNTPAWILNDYFQNSPDTLTFFDQPIAPDPAHHPSQPLFSVVALSNGRPIGRGVGAAVKEAKQNACFDAMQALNIPFARTIDKQRDNSLAWVGDRALYMIVALMGEERGYSAERMNDLSSKLFKNEALATLASNTAAGTHLMGTEVEARVGAALLASPEAKDFLKECLRGAVRDSFPELLGRIDDEFKNDAAVPGAVHHSSATEKDVKKPKLNDALILP